MENNQGTFEELPGNNVVLSEVKEVKLQIDQLKGEIQIQNQLAIERALQPPKSETLYSQLF